MSLILIKGDSRPVSCGTRLPASRLQTVAELCQRCYLQQLQYSHKEISCTVYTAYCGCSGSKTHSKSICYLLIPINFQMASLPLEILKNTSREITRLWQSSVAIPALWIKEMFLAVQLKCQNNISSSTFFPSILYKTWLINRQKQLRN